MGTKTRSAGWVPPTWIGAKGVSRVDIIFKGRRTGVQERFRAHATAKLDKVVKLDRNAIRIDVEVTKERNPRQAAQRERVELTISSRGPVIRAEAAADDRFVALDRAVAKLEARLRRACDRRKSRYAGHLNPADVLAGVSTIPPPDDPAGSSPEDVVGAAPRAGTQLENIVPIPMEGDGPLVVREKFHPAMPMTIDRALLEMELVGHDFFLFRDEDCQLASVVYRRRGYDYGVIRLVEDPALTALPAVPLQAPNGLNHRVVENRFMR